MSVFIENEHELLVEFTAGRFSFWLEPLIFFPDHHVSAKWLHDVSDRISSIWYNASCDTCSSCMIFSSVLQQLNQSSQYCFCRRSWLANEIADWFRPQKITCVNLGPNKVSVSHPYVLKRYSLGEPDSCMIRMAKKNPRRCGWENLLKASLYELYGTDVKLVFCTC